MKISGSTFLRNGQQLGYPFVAPIHSILSLVDEFITAPDKLAGMDDINGPMPEKLGIARH